nr:hypothetical protein [uncultured Dyadobacter sp.]
MKSIRCCILALAIMAPLLSVAQTQRSHQERTYQRKTTRHQVRKADSSDLNAILKDSANAETGPILNDNGNVNSTGAIDGSRSSTGRPETDTITSYTVKRKKKVIAPAPSSNKPSGNKP